MTWPRAIALVVAAVSLAGCAAANMEDACVQSPVATEATALMDGIRFVKDCEDCPELAELPAGRYLMGYSEPRPERQTREAGHDGGTEDAYGQYYRVRLGPAHCVAIDRPFAIARTEITIADWRRCQRDGACRPLPASDGVDPDFPITGLGWNFAQDYARWLSAKAGRTYRLPSEAEWEYAARGGRVRPEDAPGADKAGHPGGSSVPANQCRRSGNLYPVATNSPNPFGLYDMTINAAEWVQDCAHAYDDEAGGQEAVNAGDCSLRVVRGFQSGIIPMRGRLWFRDFLPIAADVPLQQGIGFRVVRDGGR